MNKFLTGLYHLLWYIAAVCLILAAIIVTAVRLSLPGIGSYKAEVQEWINSYSRYPIAIEDIRADWHGWVPNLYLTNIALYSPETDTQIARFANAKVDINLFTSLRQQQLIPSRLSISGLELDLTRRADGSIAISSLNESLNTNISGKQNAFAEWLLGQRYLILEDVYVKWRDDKAQLPVSEFENARVAIRNDGNRLQVDMSVTLPEHFGESLSLNLDVTGNLLRPEWDGEIYLQANKVVTDELVRRIPIRTSGGAADVRLWTSWQDARVTEVKADLAYRDFLLVSDMHSLPVKTLQVYLNALRQDKDEWLANLSLEDVETVNGKWPASFHQLSLQKNTLTDQYDYAARLSFLRLQEVLPSIIASGIVPQDWLSQVDWQSIKGDFRNIEFRGSMNAAMEDIYFSSNFTELAVTNVDQTNRIAGIDGSILLDRDTIVLELDSEQATLAFGSLYDETLSLNDIDASIYFNTASPQALEINNLNFQHAGMPVALSGQILFHEASPYVEMIAQSGDSSLEQLASLIPERPRAGFKRWFEKAFVSGEMLSADFLFRGNVNDFPFDNDEGIFKALLNVSNATLNYKKDWPLIDELTAEIVINNDDLTISANSGLLYDARFDNINGRIDNMSQGDLRLVLNADLSGHTSDVLLFIKQSPLKKNAALFEIANMSIAGGFELELEMDMPLKGGRPEIDGRFILEDTTLESNMPGLGLENMNGDIRFTRQTAWATNIDALYHGNPVTLNIPRDEKRDGRSSFYIKGQADKLFLIQELSAFFPAILQKHDLFNYIDGESDWKVTIERRKDDDKKLYRNIVIESSLRGIAVDLPAPLKKTELETKQLRVDTQMVDSQIDRIHILYGELIDAQLLVDNSPDFRIEKIIVDVGKDRPLERPVGDTVISGALEELNLGNWITFLTRKKPEVTGAAARAKKRNIAIDLDVERLALMNQDYDNTGIRFFGAGNNWQAEFDGAGIKGMATMSQATDTASRKLALDFDYLVLLKDEKEKKKPNKIDVNTMPELDVRIAQLTFKGRDLGQATLTSTNTDGRMDFNSISFKKPNVEITGNGSWVLIDGINRSQFDIAINANTLADLAETFVNEPANIDGGKTTIQLSANWMDNPFNFAMAKFNGELDVEIKKGQLLDLDPSAGRLLGLLSVTTLPRRLSLDFSDLFKKGFAFDGIEGNFNIQNGQAYTNNLFMAAPAADISISGRTGLVSEDYDQIATVMPKVTSSLPVASALFGPIGVGVGTAIFLAGEVFDSIPKQINKILSYQYSIRGSWDNPSIEKIKKENQSG